MKKMLLGLAAVFALSAAVPAFAGEEGGDAKPAKAEKKPAKKKKAPEEKKDDAAK